MKKEQPVIIVKKKGHGHGGHHGGAWKVAYADFVTAMMAFFLVMWLVNQKPSVKAAVGGYFRDPGAFDGRSSRGIFDGGTPGAEPGGTPPLNPPEVLAAIEAEKKHLEAAAEHIRESLMQQSEFSSLREQIEMTITDEGLRIELVEKNASSFFDSGSAALRGEAERILSVIAREIGTLENQVYVEGHTDSRPYARDDGNYGNWELSVDRANAARRVMTKDGLRPAQVKAVRGYADTHLHPGSDPMDPKNRRVSIVVRSQLSNAQSIGESIKMRLEEASQTRTETQTETQTQTQTQTQTH